MTKTNINKHKHELVVDDQQATVFYNGKVLATCKLTKLQAEQAQKLILSGCTEMAALWVCSIAI